MRTPVGAAGAAVRARGAPWVEALQRALESACQVTPLERRSEGRTQDEIGLNTPRFLRAARLLAQAQPERCGRFPVGASGVAARSAQSPGARFRPTVRALTWACCIGLAQLQGACLDTPPTYEAETQIPPFVIAAEVVPPLESVYTLAVNDRMRINVPFLSEDLGDALVGYILVDARTNQVAPQPTAGPFVLAPSTFSDAQRAVDEEFSLDLAASALGCHTVTLVLTHESNLSLGQPVDEARTARVVWWVNVVDPATGLETDALLADCPTTGGS